MTSDTDSRIDDFAARQHGAVARHQLIGVGVRSDAIRRRVASGRLTEVSPRVVRLTGSPDTEAGRLMAAVLDAGPRAVLSHHTAAAVWRLPGFAVEPIHVIARRGRVSETDLAVAHEPRRMSDVHVVALDGLPVTTPSRVLFDLAAAPDVSAGRLERLLDTAWARRLVSHASLHRMLADVGGRGRAGTSIMRELLADRPADFVPPESATEARFQEVARTAGLRNLERQIDVGGDDGWIGRVDFLDRWRRLVIEVGDALFHGSLSDRRHDAARWANLEGAGFTVVTVDAFEIFHRRDELVDRLRKLANDTNPLVLAARATA